MGHARPAQCGGAPGPGGEGRAERGPRASRAAQGRGTAGQGTAGRGGGPGLSPAAGGALSAPPPAAHGGGSARFLLGPGQPSRRGRRGDAARRVRVLRPGRCSRSPRGCAGGGPCPSPAGRPAAGSAARAHRSPLRGAAAGPAPASPGPSPCPGPGSPRAARPFPHPLPAGREAGRGRGQGAARGLVPSSAVPAR